MEEAPENGKESSHCPHAKMNDKTHFIHVRLLVYCLRLNFPLMYGYGIYSVYFHFIYYASLLPEDTFQLFRFPLLQQTCPFRTSYVQSDTKKRELLKNPTKIEEIQEKNY